ncbi:hypothetical protein [Helicobacter canis]|nr:hypothetical protein [Helicobacter canis]
MSSRASAVAIAWRSTLPLESTFCVFMDCHADFQSARNDRGMID